MLAGGIAHDFNNILTIITGYCELIKMAPLHVIDQTDQILKATGRAAERKVVYKQISQELENNAVWIWLFAPYEYRAAAKNVTGFIPLATGSLIELRVVDLK